MDPQTMDPDALNAFGMGAVLAMTFVGLALYLFTSYCLMRIANRTGTENGWFAFIPILNLVLLLNIAQKPLWWLVFILVGLIPIVGALFLFGAAIYLYMEVAEAVGKPKWWGIICVLVAPVGLGYLAFAD